jgi:integrase
VAAGGETVRATVKELGKGSEGHGVRCAVQIRGPLPTGELVRERYTRDFVTLGAANEWAKQRVFALIKGEDEEGTASPTLAKLWPEYEKQHIDGQRLKPSQKKALKSLWVNHLEPCFGALRVDAIGYAEVQAFKAARTDRAPKTVNNVLIALKAVLRFAVKVGKLDKAPDIELLKIPKRVPQYYDVPTYNKLVLAALELSDRHAAIVLLGGDAGLRAGEMLALTADDLALPLVTIRRTIWRGHEGTTKGNAERVIPLTARTVAVLERLSRSGGRILRTSTGKPLNQTLLNRALQQAQKRAGVTHLSLHKLRHTYGTDITRALGIRAAQALLGHADVGTTQQYAHVRIGSDITDALEASRAADGQGKIAATRAS